MLQDIDGGRLVLRRLLMNAPCLSTGTESVDQILFLRTRQHTEGLLTGRSA
jgi:hypothetical protein